MNPAMRHSTDAPAAAHDARLSIGALSRATGVPVETLRTWEQRYGYPVAERRPSGHRVYPLSVVPRLRRMAEAIAGGHRAGDVLPASDAALDRLLAATGRASRPATAWAMPGSLSTDDALALVASFDGERLTAALLSEWGRLGALGFLHTRVAPLVERVGREWAAGRLEIRHEHFLSERLGALLGSLRLPLDHQATGPVVICATLPGEAHAIGLQMAALLLAAVGLRVVYLGANMPPAELAVMAADLPAAHVALSISSAADAQATSRHLRRLRQLLPDEVGLVVGGRGAPAPKPGMTVLADFEALDAWAREAAGRRPTAGSPGGVR
jgi:MerR family transcriptional regulator, light-induced transcriptional regulator